MFSHLLMPCVMHICTILIVVNDLGGTRCNEGAVRVLLHYKPVQEHPRSAATAAIIPSRTHTAYNGLIAPLLHRGSVFKRLGSVSVLFTCSLLLHWKAEGAAPSGCPPCPPHISCSARFLRRQKFGWGSEAECAKFTFKKTPTEILSLNSS